MAQGSSYLCLILFFLHQILHHLLDLKLKILWTTWISQRRKFENSWRSSATKTYQDTGCVNSSEVRLWNIHPPSVVIILLCAFLFGILNVYNVYWCLNSVSLCVISDLDELIRHGEWKTLASSTEMNATKTLPATSRPSPPAYTKEKGQGIFLTVAW